MNRYENGKIYMIESASAGLIYYGSTCMPLAKRLHQHRKTLKRYTRGKHSFYTSFDVLDHDDHKIVLVEEVKCENKQQLLAREAHYIRTNECVNKVIPTRTRTQYCEDNKEMLAKKNAQYWKDNKEKMSQKLLCKCGCLVPKNKQSRHEKSNKHNTIINSMDQQSHTSEISS